MTASDRRGNAVEHLHGHEHVGLLANAKQDATDRQRSEAEKNSGRRPQLDRLASDPGANAATTICGTRMQAPTNAAAKSLDRMVTTLAVSGSMAALASGTALHNRRRS